MVFNSIYNFARQEMIRDLVDRGIGSRRVLAAMGRVPRERFLPGEVEHLAYADRAVPIGCSQTISQPYIVALMTEALDLTGEETVLEIGTGSGYQTAILSALALEVVSVERHESLSHGASRVLSECGIDNVRLVIGDGTLGWPERVPYDRILVAAAATRVPEPLQDQLAEGGVLVIPIGHSESQLLQKYRKIEGKLHAETLSSCRFVPLVGAQ